MALKTALNHSLYSVAKFPIKVQRTFPGNRGEGINRDAAKKIIMNVIRIGMPFKVHPHSQWEAFPSP